MAERDVFDSGLRRLGCGVRMGFYSSSADNDADVTVPRVEKDWIWENRAQLISAGLKPVKRYATCDGLIFPVVSADDPNAAYPAEDSADLIFPMWSSALCDPDTGAFAAPPVYRLSYNLPRKVNRMMLVADEVLGQAPVAYEVALDMGAQAVNAVNALSLTEGGAGDSPESFVEVAYRGPETETRDGHVYQVYRVDLQAEFQRLGAVAFGKAYARQRFDFNDEFDVEGMELRVLMWSHFGPVTKFYPNAPAGIKISTPAKIMYFSNDMQIDFGADAVASISLLEEKADVSDELSYGITANSCTVKVKNENNRFVRNRDLLKKNRIVRPELSCESGGERAAYALGKFYSDEWEVPADSRYITCKAYDVLYGLQNLTIWYGMEKNAAGAWTLDGAENGRNGTAKEVFQKIFRLVNEKRHELGIYGDDVEAVIDARLGNRDYPGVEIPYVLLGEDTAWNMLQQMANLTLSNVYVDRAGNVCVVRDDLPGETDPVFTQGQEAEQERQKALRKECATAITPSNSFSYNLPTMSRTVVNKIVVPYVELEAGKAEDNDIEIKTNDIVTKNNVCIIVVNFKNFYPSISTLHVLVNYKTEITSQINFVTSNKVKIQIDKALIEQLNKDDKLALRVATQSQCQCVQNYEFTCENDLSQKQNGVREFELDCGDLVFGKNIAEKIASKIEASYASGKSYIETTWVGSPALELGSSFHSYSRSEEQETPTLLASISVPQYECLSNEFTLEDNLRAKTKARVK